MAVALGCVLSGSTNKDPLSRGYHHAELSSANLNLVHKIGR